jgi:hypothetical protein
VNEVIRAAAALQAVCTAEGGGSAVEGIIIRQAGRLDWPYIRAQLAPLVELKEAPEILRRLEQQRRALDA